MKYLTDREYDYIYSRVPRICVDLVVKDKRGVILIKRAIEPGVGKWHLPGGMIHFNESVEHAIRRVAKDELGIKVKTGKFLGYIEYSNEVQNKRNRHSISLAFHVKPLSGRIKRDFQSSEAKFFKSLLESVYPTHKRFLTRMLL